MKLERFPVVPLPRGRQTRQRREGSNREDAQDGLIDLVRVIVHGMRSVGDEQRQDCKGFDDDFAGRSSEKDLHSIQDVSPGDSLATDKVRL